MSTVFLNGQFIPAEQASISPMDRGFLFGDGIYEVIPAYNGKLVGFNAHIDRLLTGLSILEISTSWQHDQWRTMVSQLLEKNGLGNQAIYIHVSRGADIKRYHAYPTNIEPTVFAFTFSIGNEPSADPETVKRYTVVTSADLRWQRCHIKSTALLGNVMHFQQGYAKGCDETLLFNDANQLTEASSSNAYIVKNGVVVTPPLDHQLLPGVTRKLLLAILRQHSDIEVQERIINREEVFSADEVWLSSSTKEIAPVVQIDDIVISHGAPGAVWQKAQTLFAKHRYDY